MWLGRGGTTTWAVLAFAAVLTRGEAAAQAHPVIFTSVTVPEVCPDGAALERGVRARVTPPAALDLQARVEIVASGQELVASVEIVRPSTTALRHLHAADCEALEEAITLVVAMAIDPVAAMRSVEAGTQESESESESESETESESESESTSTSESGHELADAPLVATPVASPAPLRLAFVGEGWLVGSAGLLPSASYGGLALFGVRVEGVEIALGGDVLAESRAQLVGTTRGGDLGTASGRARVAYAVELDPFEIVPSVALDLGATWGRGFGVVRPGSGIALSLDLGIGASARWFFLPELGLTLFAELVVPLVRPEFVLTGVSTTPIFRASELATLFGLGLVVRIR